MEQQPSVGSAGAVAGRGGNDALLDAAEEWEFDSLTDTSSSGDSDSTGSSGADPYSRAGEPERVELDTLSDEDSQEEADSPGQGREGLESGGGPSFEAQEFSEGPSIQEWEVDHSATNHPEDEDDCEALSQRVASVQQPPPAVQQPLGIAEESAHRGEAGDPQDESPAQAEPESGAERAQEPYHSELVQVPPWASPEPVCTPEGSQGPDDAPIWQRTRARNPLKDVSIEELEAMLQEDFLESDHDDDEAYQDFLRVLQGDDSTEPAIVPEDDEDDDDDDFELDLEELMAAGEESLEPTLSTSPLQTRFGRNTRLSPPAKPHVRWVPQEVPQDVLPSEGMAGTELPMLPPPGTGLHSPLMQTIFEFQDLAEPIASEAHNLQPSRDASFDSHIRTAALNEHQQQPAHASGQTIPPTGTAPQQRLERTGLKELALAEADALRREIALRKDMKRQKRRMKRKAIMAELEQLRREVGSKRRRTQEGQGPPIAAAELRHSEGAGAQPHPHTAHAHADRQQQAPPQAQMWQSEGLAQAEQQLPEGHDAVGKPASGNEIPVAAPRPPNQMPAANVPLPSNPSNQMAPAASQPASVATTTTATRRSQRRSKRVGERPTGASIVQQQRQRVLVPGPAVPPQMRLPRLPVLNASDQMVSVPFCPPPCWTLQQLGQFRRQVAHHLQQMCHIVALLKCSCYDNQLLQRSRALLIAMVGFCMQAMGLKESRGSPYLPQEVIAPLELECPDAAIHSPVRSLLAVPILLHVAPLLDATPVTPQPPRPNAARAPVPASTQVGGKMQAAALAATAGPLPPLTGAVQAAMEQMREVMCPRLVPQYAAMLTGWSPGEKDLLRHGMARFGNRADLIQKFLLPTKTVDNIRSYVKVEQDRAQPMAERLQAPPLTPTELSIIRETIQEHRGNRQVWDIISQQKLRYRDAEELKALYWATAYRADTKWKKINPQATTTARGAAQRTAPLPFATAPRLPTVTAAGQTALPPASPLLPGGTWTVRPALPPPVPAPPALGQSAPQRQQRLMAPPAGGSSWQPPTAGFAAQPMPAPASNATEMWPVPQLPGSVSKGKDPAPPQQQPAAAPGVRMQSHAATAGGRTPALPQQHLEPIPWALLRPHASTSGGRAAAPPQQQSAQSPGVRMQPHASTSGGRAAAPPQQQSAAAPGVRMQPSAGVSGGRSASPLPQQSAPSPGAMLQPHAGSAEIEPGLQAEKEQQATERPTIGQANPTFQQLQKRQDQEQQMQAAETDSARQQIDAAAAVGSQIANLHQGSTLQAWTCRTVKSRTAEIRARLISSLGGSPPSSLS